MAGGLMQLVAYGAQDVYLTSNPQITFWRVTYRRATNFSMESIEQTFSGQVDFGRKVQCVISRNGDLAFRTYLQVTLPEVNQDVATEARWLDYIGEHLISTVEIEVGGQRLDRHYGAWLHIWNQLTLSKSQEAGYKKMVGHTTALTYLTNSSYSDVDGPCATTGVSQVCEPRNALPETTLYVPLQFWWNRNPGCALPLIALQYHECKINLELRPLSECIWAKKDAAAANLNGLSLVAGSLYVDYIFLDTDERRRAAQNPAEYLIEQLQFTGEESIGSSSNKIKLSMNHPVKELIWTVQPDEHVEYCHHYTEGEAVCRAHGAQPFNFTDAIDALPRELKAFKSSGNAEVDVSGLLNEEEAVGVTDAAAFVLAETARDMHCWGQNPVVTAKLAFNGQDRFSERLGSYFDVVQPFQHHTRTPDTGINVYSFALRPEEHQPSGSANMSRLDSVTLHLVVSHNTVGGDKTAKVRVYGVNYNVFRVMSGMGGVAYAN